MKEFRGALPALPLALLAGCFGTCGACSDNTPSTNVRTSGVRAELTIVAEDRGMGEASARLRVGGALSNTFLDLAGGDRVDVEVAGRTTALLPRRGVIEPPAYAAKVAGLAAGAVVAFKLTRPADTSALGSTVTLPEPIALITPKPSEPVSSKAPVVATWKAVPGSDVRWTAQGTCIDEGSGTVIDDVGRVEVPLPAARRFDAGSAPPCDVTLVFERWATGSLDPAFGEGGSVLAVQRRTRVVRWSP